MSQDKLDRYRQYFLDGGYDPDKVESAIAKIASNPQIQAQLDEALGMDEQVGMVRSGLDTAARFADRPAGGMRLLAGEVADAVTGRDTISKKDWRKALRGKAPTTGELMDRHGVPEGPSVYVPIPGIQGDVSVRGAVSTIGDMALDPLNLASLGTAQAVRAGKQLGRVGKAIDMAVNPMGRASEKAGDTAYRSAFANIDRRLMEKKTQPLSQTFIQEGRPSAWTMEGLEEVADGLKKNINTRQQERYQRASNLGARITDQPARDAGHGFISSIQATDNRLDPNFVEKLREYVDRGHRMDPAAKAQIEHHLSKQTEDFARQINQYEKDAAAYQKQQLLNKEPEFTKQTRLGVGPLQEPLMPGPTPRLLTDMKGGGLQEVVAEPTMIRPVDDLKLPIPDSGDANILKMQRDLDSQIRLLEAQPTRTPRMEQELAMLKERLEATMPEYQKTNHRPSLSQDYLNRRFTEALSREGQQMEMPIPFEMPEPPTPPMTPAVPEKAYRLEDAQAIKTRMRRNLPKDAYGEVAPDAHELDKVMSGAYQTEIENAASAVSPDLGATIKADNRSLGSLIEAETPVDIEVRKEIRKSNPSSVDGGLLGHAVVDPVHGGLIFAGKKGADAWKGPGIRTKVGNALYKSGRSGVVDPIIRKILIDANASPWARMTPKDEE